MFKLDLAYWKGTLVSFQAVKCQSVFTRKMIRHAKRRVKQIERRVLVACCLLLLVMLTGCGAVSGLCQDVKWLSDTTQQAILDAE